MAFECIECGYAASKWMGRCSRCDQWNTIVEVNGHDENKSGGSVRVLRATAEKLTEVKTSGLKRITSGMAGIDRILGGGVVEGEVVLLGGPPGVGKSTLFLQLADRFAGKGKKVLFVSGEESLSQIKLTADRLKIEGKNITVIATGDLVEVDKVVERIMPDIIFVDSIQAMVDTEHPGGPGTLKQVKESGQKLTAMAKNTGAVILISGQITKQGSIAGPKVLEHMVDAVLYIDSGEGNMRIIGSSKNRFGPCGDFVLYSLTEAGLLEADGYGAIQFKEEDEVIGQISSCIRVGARLIHVELQSLVSASYFEYPLRRTSGYSRQRLLMLTAIAEKHLGLNLGSKDIYMNVSGGNRVTERASDLGVIGAVYSSFKNIPVAADTMFLGEVGLSGEVRPLPDISQRIRYAVTNNFKTVVLSGFGKVSANPPVKLRYIKSVKELREIL